MIFLFLASAYFFIAALLFLTVNSVDRAYNEEHLLDDAEYALSWPMGLAKKLIHRIIKLKN